MNADFILKYSRWKTILPIIFGSVIFLMGYGFVTEFFFGTGLFAVLCSVLFGISLLFFSTFLISISLIRLVKKPKVIQLSMDNIIYYYATFCKPTKVITIPWEDVDSISFDSTIIYSSKDIGETNIQIPNKISYLKIVVKSNVLGNYSCFRHNIFLSSNKRTLSIITDPLGRFSKEKFMLYCKNKMNQ